MGCANVRCSDAGAPWDPASSNSLDPAVMPRCSPSSPATILLSRDLKKYPDVIAYTVDGDGIILDIMTADTWDTSAKAGGVTVSANALAGRSLFSFMLPFLQSFYSELLAGLHCSPVGSSVSFRWFCDSPKERREMVLYLERAAAAITILSITVDVRCHRAGFLQHLRVVDDMPRKSCSMCNRFCRDGEWLAPEVYYSEMSKEVDFSALTVTHAVCPDCSQHVVTRLAPGFSRAHGLTRAPSNGSLSLGRQQSPPQEVLIVDDDAITCRVLEALVRALGFVPYVLTDPALMFDFLEEHQVHTVLLDVVMPDFMGYECVQRLRRRGMKQRVICMSGCAEYRKECLDAGAQGFLLKPITSATLLGTLFLGSVPLDR